MSDYMDMKHLQKRHQLENIVKDLSETDLVHLNRIIVERLKLLSQMKASMKLSDFHNGQRVSFNTQEGERKRGVIIRLNKKTASILTEDGVQWNVSPDFLERE